MILWKRRFLKSPNKPTDKSKNQFDDEELIYAFGLIPVFFLKSLLKL